MTRLVRFQSPTELNYTPTLYINPKHVASIEQHVSGETRLTMRCGRQHLIYQEIGDVVQRLRHPAYRAADGVFSDDDIDYYKPTNTEQSE